MGELAPRLGLEEQLYRGLRPEVLALLMYLSQRVHEYGGATAPLVVTSTVRDDPYQALLREDNSEATSRLSLHTTGYAFDIRRRYESTTQARAFQYMLDDLAARGLIAWVREPAAIHITISTETRRSRALLSRAARRRLVDRRTDRAHKEMHRVGDVFVRLPD